MLPAAMKRLHRRRWRTNGGDRYEPAGLKLGLGWFNRRKDEREHWSGADLCRRSRRMGRQTERATRFGRIRTSLCNRARMKMHDFDGREDGKHQYAENHRPFHGRGSIELAFPFHDRECERVLGG